MVAASAQASTGCVVVVAFLVLLRNVEPTLNSNNVGSKFFMILS
jgi:hypothetical protein